MSEPNGDRSHTVRWADPAVLVRAARTMNGLELMRAVQSGSLPPPPVGPLVGLRIVTADEGRVVAELTPAEYQYNPLGSVHGGVLVTAMDSVMSCAVHTTLPLGVGYSTLEVKANFVRPVRSDTGTVRCEGTVLHTGRRVATAESRVVDADGRLYAHGTATCMILAPESGAGR